MNNIKPSENIDRLVFQIGRLHFICVHSRLENLGLYPGQPPLLNHLSEQDGRSQTELADLMHVRPATMNRMVIRMEKAGFVARVQDTADQRATKVYLTPTGREVHQKAKQVKDDMNQLISKGFSPEELARAEVILTRIRENLLQSISQERSDI